MAAALAFAVGGKVSELFVELLPGERTAPALDVGQRDLRGLRVPLNQHSAVLALLDLDPS
jgi:hypothetical protein